MKKQFSVLFVLIAFLLIHTGCAALYGWNLHAPGLLSSEFAADIPQASHRVALYIPEGMIGTISKDKGTWYSDPQTYYIGEAFAPMLIEAFQHGFKEFVLMEAEPTTTMMQRYGIEYLAVVTIKDFKNRHRIKGQGLDLLTETTIFKPDLSLLARFETRGTSEAPGIFAKKGGPEVNLNNTIESNLRSVVNYTQELLQTGTLSAKTKII